MKGASFWALSGCVPAELEPVTFTEVQATRPPAFLEVGKACDVDESVWTFSAVTDAWTDGGWVLLTVDGIYLEKFRVDSVGAARDGSADQLQLQVPFAVDWRDDEGTAFACAAAPSGQFQVLALDGTQSDCRHWGDPSVFGEELATVCPEPL